MHIQNTSSVQGHSGVVPQGVSDTPTLPDHVADLSRRSELPPLAVQQPPVVLGQVAVEQRPYAGKVSPQLLDGDAVDDFDGRSDESDWMYFVDSDSDIDSDIDADFDMEIDSDKNIDVQTKIDSEPPELGQSIVLLKNSIATLEKNVLTAANQLFQANQKIHLERAHTSQGPRASSIDARDRLSKNLENQQRQLKEAEAQIEHFSGLLLGRSTQQPKEQ
jgi:hypothetical protein